MIKELLTKLFGPQEDRPFVMTNAIWQEHTDMLRAEYPYALFVEDIDLAHRVFASAPAKVAGSDEWQSLPNWNNTTQGVVYMDTAEELACFKELYAYFGGIRTV